ncbi:MAG: membrane protein insertase YidC [Candidatus Kaelpia imicola]|nr:membrane protein insertase YidC [Candidatus Kaelpia imicola]
MENNKRILLATALAFLVMLAYPYYAKRYIPQRPHSVAPLEPETLVAEEDLESAGAYDTVYDTVISDDTVDDTVIENQELKIELNTRSGVVKSVKIKDGLEPISFYPLQDKRLGLLMPTVSTVSFEESKDCDTAEMVLSSNGVRREYSIDKHLLLFNTEGESQLLFYMPGKYEVSMRESRYLRVMVKDGRQNTESIKIGSLLKKKRFFNAVDWFALSFRHYSILFDPSQDLDLEIKPSSDQEGFFFAIKGKTENIEVLTYIGPNSESILAFYDDNWLDLLNYGKLNNIVKSLLGIFYKVSHNYGLAIIMLALLLNFIFAPLTLKSQKSMKKMQSLQPHMQELKEKHKDNPQAVNKEMMELYKKHKVNPMGGCLPMFLQIPVFIALYNTLMRSYELKHASFLWIKDLSVPDRLFMLSKSLPLIGSEVNLLPILMAGLMFVQQKFSPTAKVSSSSTMPNLWFLPIIFGVIFYKFPAGLVLYWFTNSLSMLVLQNMHRK